MQAHGLMGWRASATADQWLSAAVVLLTHELGALSGHWADLEVRASVARRAGTLWELLADQIDLLPETRIRMARDRALRRDILRHALARRSQSGS